MNRRDITYGSTLNLFGSDVNPPDVQAAIDRERNAADHSHRLHRAHLFLVAHLPHRAAAKP